VGRGAKIMGKRNESPGFLSLKLSTINKKCGAMWSKVDNFFLI
jgi:hypothetical protein